MEISLAELQRNLKTIRLHGMSATLETRLVQANQGASFAEVFSCLVQDEMDSRNSRLVYKPGSMFRTSRPAYLDRVRLGI